VQKVMLENDNKFYKLIETVIIYYNSFYKTMPLPTMLREGFLKPNDGTPKKEKDRLKNVRPVDYIMNFISDRIPASPGMQPKIAPKGPGDKVIVLKSETGSGKSTAMPPFLYETFQERTRKFIGVTQPRVLTAIDIPTNLPEFYPFLQMDVNLGYSTGPYKRMPKEKGLIYMTVGVLLVHLKTMDDESFMKRYSFIVIDELHDRNISNDLTMFLLKKLINLHWDKPECPFIILTSATFDKKIFVSYFNTPPENYMSVVGSTFPIEPHILEFDKQDFIKKAIDTAEELHVKNIDDIKNNEMSRDIIIFVSGKSPSKKILEALHLFNSKILVKSFSEVEKYISEKPKERRKEGGGGESNYYIAPIDLSSSEFHAASSEYQNLFSNIDNISIPLYAINGDKLDRNTIKQWVKPTRRIIVTTNIAETGVTIDTLKYCIDTGFVNEVNFNPDFGCSTMITKQITRGSATQRKGRVGRKANGIWYPLYTEDTFNALAEDQFADILTNDISDNLLTIIIKETETTIEENPEKTLSKKQKTKKNIFKTNYLTDHLEYHLQSLKSLNVSAIDFLEMPSGSSLTYSIEKLYTLGFINNSYKPTILGYYGNMINKLSIENRRFLLAGYSHGANVLDLITIVSFLENPASRSPRHRNYKPINPNSKLSKKEYEFYYKVVIGDEMVDSLFIWEMYSEFLEKQLVKSKKKTKKGQDYAFDTNETAQWCLDNKLIYENMHRVTLTRNEIIENFINIGLNPYYNGLGLDKGTYNIVDLFRNNLDEFVGEVHKIKECALDGYRLNLCIWNNDRKRYILQHRNVPIMVRNTAQSRMGDDAVQTNANFIICTGIMLISDMRDRNKYNFESSGTVCVLDSYLNIDLDFLKN
jgi:HrpA-like RNA helicase